LLLLLFSEQELASLKTLKTLQHTVPSFFQEMLHLRRSSAQEKQQEQQVLCLLLFEALFEIQVQITFL